MLPHRQSKMLTSAQVPGRVLYACDYEYPLGDGVVRIYKGHPQYRPKTARHPAHNHRFSFRLRDGSVHNGSYWCDGDERKEFPKRFIDMTAAEQTAFEQARDHPEDPQAPKP